ncbi:16S rRNA (cytosine(967)-C(5))-methyltransferase RsmB [Senegalia massiliensis]|uniref:16S rRNA (cytosine(967)-C(5))-methyltransferase n=1 Tax=Senegalia massiliensis TaxID=1720316 RepID=A0A845QY11_9CLOT|nr:16S rRNA (cytosine(967)-C(5))-methyltransferase RsmB [Senegalia massiliensis]NBI06884.1 16S rRNA (cytosine(967)-C(5))-methyltransferase RsmB [Senegalia massiliensis]
MKNNARKIAIEILELIENEKAYSNIEINKKVKLLEDIREQNFVRELVYGVLENKLYIDNIISQFSNTKINKIDNIILQILRTGVYQIYFMKNIPESAVCNEAVKIAKNKNKKRLSGFVNGILRNISRNKNKEFLPDKSTKLVDYLSIKYSHPKWMVKHFIDDYNEDFTEKLLSFNNEKPPLIIRVNRLKIDRESLMNKFMDYNIKTERTKYSKDGLVVHKPKNITGLEEFKKGFFTIQDESSQLVAQIMNPKEGSNVIDVCSAPGGKSTHIAELMNNKGSILSRDIFEHKLNLIEQNSKRLGIDIINTENFDALKFDKKIQDSMDYCLVDAPCSGLGLLRRKPDIRWNKSKEDIEDLSNIQLNILEIASKYLKKGGILIYSTCTISKKENIEVVNKFLKNNINYKLEKIDNLYFEDKSKLEEGHITLLPNIHGTDGFFIAKIKRIR